METKNICCACQEESNDLHDDPYSINELYCTECALEYIDGFIDYETGRGYNEWA